MKTNVTNARIGELPNYLLIGATKGGTTSLHAYLSSHPDIFMHPVKELRYFSAEHNWARGEAWYWEQFADVHAAKAIGEASNSYARFPIYGGVPERIANIKPDMRFVYAIRHPLERIESHYRHRIVTGVEWRSASAALAEDPSYLAVSRYAYQLEQYLQHFPREQILVVRSEQLKADPEVTLRRIYEFLGVDANAATERLTLNVSAERRSAPAWLREFSRFPALRPHVKRLAFRLRRSPLGRFSALADALPFAPCGRPFDELIAVLKDDLHSLGELLQEDFSDWDLDG